MDAIATLSSAIASGPPPVPVAARPDGPRQERDLFLSFAFAAGDLFLRVDPSGLVSYAIGASRRIVNRDTASLEGLPFDALIAVEDRRVVQLALTALSPGSRLPMLELAIAPPADDGTRAAVSGWRDARDGTLYLALSALNPVIAANARRGRQGVTGLHALDEFQRLAAERLDALRELGGQAQLTMIDMPGLETLTRDVGDRVADVLLADIAAALRWRSIGGNSAGQLGPERMGFLHEPHVDARATVDDVASRLAEVDGGGEVAVAHRTVRMDPGPLNEADGGKAIRFAIQRFADSGAEGFGVGTAEDGLKLLLADTVARLTAFREIMAANSFRLVFQPILALRDREVHHWEALTRFGASESPADVIKFAEGVNVIDELDLAVVASVLTTLQARAARGLRDRVAVNLSARTIDSDLFLAALDDVLVRHEDVRDQVLFEITETASITDLERAAKVLQRLRQRGNAVCLDDFGAGATSIPYLQQLPVDYVKIDGGHVRAIAKDSRQRAITAGIVRLCGDLEIGTIAEMIESEDQATVLEDMGVGFGQGWLFGRPVDRLP